MNYKRLFFCLLVLNAVAIGLLWQSSQDRSVVADPTMERKKPSLTRPNPSSKSTIQVVTNQVVQSFDWRSVESEDYRKYIANLRAVGCPEETIRDIIKADVDKLFASRMPRTAGRTNRFEFWKADQMFAGAPDEKTIEQQQALAKEKRALLKELLGVEIEEKPSMASAFQAFEGMFDSMLDFLPTEKQTQAVELEQRFSARLAKVLEGGHFDEEEWDKIRKEKEAELAKILTPQELEDYQLRMSDTAMTLRMSLAHFNPTEQEFREIFKLQKQFDDEFSSHDFDAQDAGQTYQKAREELETKLRKLLGDDRYKAYERSNDYEFQNVARIARKNGLPEESAIKVYDLKKLMESERERLDGNTLLSGEERQKELEAIYDQTEKAIKAVLGDKAYEAYKKSGYSHSTTIISPGSRFPSLVASEHSSALPV